MDENSNDKRIFVGGLSERITDDDLKKTFSRFGSVKEVSIKRKHGASGAVEMFAFVNLDCIQSELSRCFSLLSNTKWKGSRIVVQLAKESYMDRLKKERETQQAKPSVQIQPPPQAIQAPSQAIQPAKPKPKIEVKPVERKIKIESFQPKIKVEPKFEKKLRDEPKTFNQSTSENVDTHTNSLLSRYSTKKKALSEMKRLESQQALVKMHKERIQAISSSLMNPDKAMNKKVKFDDANSDNESEDLNQSIEPSKAKSLFNASSDEDDDVKELEAFADKPQFEGKKGEKLLNLQAGYNNDPRFALNEKFISESEDEEDNDNHEGNNLVNEGKKNLGILEEVLGHQVSNHDEAMGLHSISKKNQFKDFGFLRYDPKKSDAEKFIVKPNSEDKSEKKKKLSENPVEKEVDLTDTNRFYDVSEELSKALESTKSGDGHFKLLNDSSESESELHSNDNETIADAIKQAMVTPKQEEFNPIDMTPLEWGMEQDEEVLMETDIPIKNTSKPIEFFFMQKNDPRLEEGIKFMFENQFNTNPKQWAEKRIGLLRYMATRRKYALKRQKGALVYKTQASKRPQYNKRTGKKYFKR